MNARPVYLPLSCALLLAGGLACPAGEPKVVDVVVGRPVLRQVTEYADFTGRTDAVESVEVRARVSGYLVKLPFKEGAEVKAGELLFEIDARPYQAQYEQALGQVALAKGSLKLARLVYERDLIINKTPGAISVQQLDQDRAAVEEADLRVKAAEASLDIHKVNLDFTKVRAPIDGQISRYYVTRGNLVNQDQTLLTTIVSRDPMYVSFDMDEATLLRIRRSINEGKLKPLAGGPTPVHMGLAGEDGHPHHGTVNFIDNQVNPKTSTIQVRGVFANPRPADGVRLLSPGMSVRIRLPIAAPHAALLVPASAVSDGKRPYAFVVNSKNVVEFREIKLGQAHGDLREVVTGLGAEDWIAMDARKCPVGGSTVRPKKSP